MDIKLIQEKIAEYKAKGCEVPEPIAEYKAKGCEVPEPEMIKTPEQIEGIRAAAKINNACLDLIAEKIK